MIKQKNMPIGQFFKATISMLKNNIKDILLISLIFSIPGMLFGSSNFITSFITLLASVVGLLSIIILIDNRRNGISMTWKESIKEVVKNPFVPILVFIAKNMIVNIGYMITPLLSQIILIVLFAALPYAVLEKCGVIDSFKLSFNMIKSNFLDILLKKLCIVLIANLFVMLIGSMFMTSFLASTFVVLLNILLLIPDLIMYYDIKKA